MISLGLVADLASKEKGDHSMPTHPVVGPRRTGRRIWGTRVIWRKLDCLKSNLQPVQLGADRKVA